MPLHEDCRQYTAFIYFRGLYETTRVPMGLLPSTTYFQKSMGVYVLSDLLYRICEVYIDDMLIIGSDDDNFIANVRTVFQRCREKYVTINSKTLMIGKDKIPFVGHEIDSSRIKMSEKRIEGAIAFTTPRTLKELQSFLGLINYFKDHLRDYSLMPVPCIDS